MKYIYTFLFALLMQFFAFGQQQTVTYSVLPATFNEDESITITFDGSSINESTWGIVGNALYLWAWSFDTNDLNSLDCPTNGTWTASNESNKLTYNAGTDKYSITFIPKNFYSRTGIGKIGFLLKAKDGTGDKKSQDIFLEVGKFQLTAATPVKNSVTFVNSGTSVLVSGTASLPATFQLKANGTVVQSTSVASTNYSYNYSVTTDAAMELIATNAANPAETGNNPFTLALTPSVQTAAIPTWIKQGINYDPANPTKVGLALYAPGKSYVHVIGSFNNWSVNSNYLMKRDTTNPNLYWIEITGLTSQQVYTFQYRTNDGKKVADPFSPLVLNPYDDPYISATTYPSLPAYPVGQNFDVSVVQTGMPAYSWVVPNFTRPAKENLIIYELLVRDFTAEQTWQSLIDKITYLKTLNINAIELMPVMEFDGNSSWGYNTSFHYALDKAYGTPNKFKEFIDTCHQKGIAVILDIALNHATGRSPLVRLWNIDPDGDGFGSVAADNPYFNQVATHSYSVFEDFNHSKAETKYYVERVLEQWIKEYKVDGFRWDLTKGFTQNATGSDANTNAYQQDRVDVLKYYVDKQWSFDPASYAIFEHLGTDLEEQQWANYRVAEGKGVMTWDKEVDPYNQNTMGFSSGSNFDRVDYENHGFLDRRADSYGESHDEERLMYKNLTYGAQNGTYNVKNIDVALERQKAYASVFLTVPGPKMIWQFAELGFDMSIFRCSDGSVNTSTDAIAGDCKLDPKPSAFFYFYNYDFLRTAVYDTWAKILSIKLNNSVFKTKTFTIESGNLMPRIYIWDDSLPASSLKNIVILANFTTSAQNIVPNFPYTGSWYNLMNNSSVSVSNTVAPISLQPGEFRIFGNATSLSTDSSVKDITSASIEVLQNPVANDFAQIRFKNAKGGTIYLYDITGKMLKSIKVLKDNGDELISVGNLQKGLYLLQLKSEKGLSIAKMIIK